MKETAIRIVVGTLGIVSKGPQKRLGEIEKRGKIETIKTTTLLRSPRILRRVLETRRDLL